MGWNEKNARQVNKAPKRVIDKFDLEAESEGRATSFFDKNEVSPSNIGRRLAKNRRKMGRGAAIVGCKRVDNFTKDHQAVMDKVIIPQQTVRQLKQL
jgi:hypothetical protein